MVENLCRGRDMILTCSLFLLQSTVRKCGIKRYQERENSNMCTHQCRYICHTGVEKQNSELLRIGILDK